VGVATPPSSREPSDKKSSARALAGRPRGEPSEVPHPSGDNRFTMLDACMKRHRFAPDALIEVLHTAQELFGFLQNDLLHYVAHGLKVPPSRVYGVATFYHFFSFAPKGKHTCVVCTGTACYVKGADALLAAIERQLGTTDGKTSADGQVSLMTARCLGACGLAPVVVFDGEVSGKQEPESALERLKGWKSDGSR